MARLKATINQIQGLQTALDGKADTGEGGGLTHFVEDFNNSGIHASRPISSLSPTDGSSFNMDVALIPKGTGGFSLSLADGTEVGGNKIGAHAISLMTARSLATQVASGFASTLIGGYYNCVYSTAGVVIGGNSNSVLEGNENAILSGSSNTLSGNNSFAITGTNNTVGSGCNYSGILGGASCNITTNSSGSAIITSQSSTINNSSGAVVSGGSNANITSSNNSIITGGYQHTISGSSNSVVLGGVLNNITSGNNSIIIGGLYNTINANYSQVGGTFAHTKDIMYTQIYSGANFTNTSDGSVQTRETHLIGGTNASSSAVITTNNGGVGYNTNQISLKTNESKTIVGFLKIIDASDIDIETTYEIKFTARNKAGTVSITTASPLTLLEQHATALSNGHSATVTVDEYNPAVKFTINKTGGGDIKAVAFVKCYEFII